MAVISQSNYVNNGQECSKQKGTMKRGLITLIKNTVKSHIIEVALSFILLLLFYITYFAYSISLHSGKRVSGLLKGHGRPQLKFVNFTIKINHNIETFVYQRYETVEGGNSALILEEGCRKRNIQRDCSKIELITGFIDLNDPAYGKALGGLRHLSDEPNNAIFEARQMEVINVLQVNLLHYMVSTVHVLVWTRSTAEFLKSLDFKNSHMLVIRVAGKDVGLKEQLEYASDCLESKVVAITNQDNTLGRGWENKEYLKILTEKNIMYGLTRHSTATESPSRGSNCTWMQIPQNNCDTGGMYLGSHDTFVFQARKWTSTQLEELSNITPDMPHMESFLLWFFQERLNYKILNPCKIMFVHHHHCVVIRGLNRFRVNFAEKNVSAGFTDKLE